MAKWILTATSVFSLLLAGDGRFPGQDLALGKPNLALVVNLQVPAEEKYAKVSEILDKVKERGATHWTLRVSKKGEGASAEVVSQPQTPSHRVAAVVAELLDRGIKKISVEVRK